jgi:hypothetical protein
MPQVVKFLGKEFTLAHLAFQACFAQSGQNFISGELMGYQPIAFGCKCSRVSVGTGFVSMSSMFSLDSTGSMAIHLEVTCSWKKWYFTFICLVHGFIWFPGEGIQMNT